jgi:transcriptional regulator with XRE-family HTH domain
LLLTTAFFKGFYQMKKIVSNVIRSLRHSAGLSQQQLCNKCGFNRSNYARMEVKGTMMAHDFFKMLGALDISEKKMMIFLDDIKIAYKEEAKRKQREELWKDVEPTEIDPETIKNLFKA